MDRAPIVILMLIATTILIGIALECLLSLLQRRRMDSLLRTGELTEETAERVYLTTRDRRLALWSLLLLISFFLVAGVTGGALLVWFADS